RWSVPPQLPRLLYSGSRLLSSHPSIREAYHRIPGFRKRQSESPPLRFLSSSSAGKRPSPVLFPQRKEQPSHRHPPAERRLPPASAHGLSDRFPSFPLSMPHRSYPPLSSCLL